MKFENVFKLTRRSFAVIVVMIWLISSIGCTVFGIRTVEEASYEVLSQDGQIEIREYEKLVIVETNVEADYEEAGNIAFKRLFGYISGENVSQNKIAMTAPVIAREDKLTPGEKLDMTTPVLAERQVKGWRYAFVLPASFTIESAPVPSNPRVTLSVMPKKKVAVNRYSGSWSEEAMCQKTEELVDWIQANGLEPASKSRSARYDPPWTISFLRRNEVMIDLK